MSDDDLRLAPAGASDAACAVCLHVTFNRIAVRDGHVPICSTFCLQAWPRVRALLADRDRYRRALEEIAATSGPIAVPAGPFVETPFAACAGCGAIDDAPHRDACPYEIARVALGIPKEGL